MNTKRFFRTGLRKKLSFKPLDVIEIKTKRKKLPQNVKAVVGDIHELPLEQFKIVFNAISSRVEAINKLRSEVNILIPSKVANCYDGIKNCAESMKKRGDDLTRILKSGEEGKESARKIGILQKKNKRRIEELEKRIKIFNQKVKELETQRWKLGNALKVAEKRNYVVVNIGGVPMAFKVEKVVRAVKR